MAETQRYRADLTSWLLDASPGLPGGSLLHAVMTSPAKEGVFSPRCPVLGTASHGSRSQSPAVAQGWECHPLSGKEAQGPDWGCSTLPAQRGWTEVPYPKLSTFSL